MKKILVSVLLFFVMMWHASYAQEFHKGQQMLMPAVQVLPDQYIIVPLPETDSNQPSLNVFDPANPYTYLQVIYDSRHRPSHIIYQTNFVGKILFLAYSNNLSVLFNKRNKPVFHFQKCIRNINQYLSPLQVTDLAIGCIIDRLNYCAEE